MRVAFYTGQGIVDDTLMRKEVEREQQNASRGEMAQPMNTLVRVFGRKEVIQCH